MKINTYILSISLYILVSNQSIISGCIRPEINILQDDRNFLETELLRTITEYPYNNIDDQLHDIESIIQNGADLNWHDNNNQNTTILIESILHNSNLEIISLLLEYGANPYMSDIYGENAFTYAQRYNRLNALHLLYEYASYYR